MVIVFLYLQLSLECTRWWVTSSTTMLWAPQAPSPTPRASTVCLKAKDIHELLLILTQTLKWNADRHVTVLYVLLCTVYTVASVVIIYLLQALWKQIPSRSSLKNLQTSPMWRKPWREFTTMIAAWLKSTLTTSRSAHWNVTIMEKLCTDKKKLSKGAWSWTQSP